MDELIKLLQDYIALAKEIDDLDRRINNLIQERKDQLGGS